MLLPAHRCDPAVLSDWLQPSSRCGGSVSLSPSSVPCPLRCVSAPVPLRSLTEAGCSHKTVFNAPVSVGDVRTTRPGSVQPRGYKEPGGGRHVTEQQIPERAEGREEKNTQKKNTHGTMHACTSSEKKPDTCWTINRNTLSQESFIMTETPADNKHTFCYHFMDFK